jgi:CheY-like chemotaxis protein
MRDLLEVELKSVKQCLAKVLVVDDEPSLLDAIGFTLEHEGYEALSASTGEQGLKLFQSSNPDLVILDLMLPDCSGVDICKAMRILGNVPILFLTARDQLEDKVEAFESGADDYLPKPFRYKELVMRVKALLRRTTAGESNLSFGGIVLEPSSRQVKHNGELLHLTLREYQLLDFESGLGMGRRDRHQRARGADQRTARQVGRQRSQVDQNCAGRRLFSGLNGLCRRDPWASPRRPSRGPCLCVTGWQFLTSRSSA